MNRNADVEHSNRGYPTGKVQWLLRVESLAIFAASITLFHSFGGELWLFAALFFAPDLSLVGYAAGKKVGAVFYNTAHSYAPHAALAVISVLTDLELLWQIALIFTAHAAFDRSLGYGLKYTAGFRHTHLGPIRNPAQADD